MKSIKSIKSIKSMKLMGLMGLKTVVRIVFIQEFVYCWTEDKNFLVAYQDNK